MSCQEKKTILWIILERLPLDSESNRHPADSEAGIRFSTAEIAAV
jgi:hypothetical protein